MFTTGIGRQLSVEHENDHKKSVKIYENRSKCRTRFSHVLSANKCILFLKNYYAIISTDVFTVSIHLHNELYKYKFIYLYLSDVHKNNLFLYILCDFYISMAGSSRRPEYPKWYLLVYCHTSNSF